MNPRVSVLLPVWNAGVDLAVCLRSLLRQTEARWECVLVDDGSSDDSLAIARAFAARDPRFVVLAREHAGLIAALETGLSRCRAPLVARMDADDWMHGERLALQCGLLDRAPDLDAVGCFVRSFPRARLGPGARRYERWLTSLSSAELVHRDRFVECAVVHPTLVVRRERLEALRYQDLGWPEDYDLILRLLAAGPRIGVVPRRLLGWRDRPDRTSRRDRRYALDRFTACRAHYLSRDFLAGRREYLLWGHGPTGRALKRALAAHGHAPAAVVEVHPRRLGRSIAGAPVIAPDALGPPAALPLIASVAGEAARTQIRGFLAARGWHDGRDFVCAA